jgi:hypothetical protein
MLWMWLLAGCSLLGGGDTGPSCDLTLEGLPGTSWVMLAAQGGVEKKDHIARLRFDQKGEEIVAKYTVASPSDVYEYPCVIREADDEEEGGKDELYCSQPQRTVAWCQALLVADEVCSKKKLRQIGAEGTDEELNKAIIEAKANVREMRDKGGQDWMKFKFLNNNLANKLQGRLYISIDEKQCRLSVGDFYWTIFNGRDVEDTNPVGQNPFVKGDGEYLWEHCNDGSSIAMTEAAEVDLDSYQRPGTLGVGKETFYTYLGENTQKAEEGCSYSADVYASWRPVEKGIEVPAGDDGALSWQVKHTWSADNVHEVQGKQVGVLTMVRHKNCGGTKEKIDTVCDVVLVE